MTSQGLPRLQAAGNTVPRVVKRKQFAHDRSQSGTIPVRRREEIVCGDAAIMHWCSSPQDPRVLSPHRLLGAAILLARPLSEAGLPLVTSGSQWSLKARLPELIEIRRWSFRFPFGCSRSRLGELDAPGGQIAGARGRKACRGEVRALESARQSEQLERKLNASSVVTQADLAQPVGFSWSLVSKRTRKKGTP